MLKVRFVALCLLVVALVCFSGQPQESNARLATPTPPAIKVRYRYYPIAGSTAQQLRSQMSQRGPIDRISGSRFDANTSWSVHWTYHYSQQGKQCAINDVQGNVDVLFILPRWKQPARVEQSLISEWNDYFAALKTHENGHKANGVAAIQKILQTLATLPAYPSCRKLQIAANAAAEEVVKTYNQRDIEYDRLTRHGYTQGAVFPAIATVSR